MANAVAENHNWVQRIEGEQEAAEIWGRNWGELYAGDQPTDNKGMIRKIEEKMKHLPVQSMMTNSQLSFTWNKPYVEPKNYRLKTFGGFEDMDIEIAEAIENGKV